MERLGKLITTLGVATAMLASSMIARGDDPEPPQRPPADNPISRFLDRVFEGARDPQPQEAPPKESEPVVRPAVQFIPDAIDERAAAGREQQRDLVLAQRLLRTGDRSAALSLMQGLLNAEEDTLILSNDGNWDSLQQTTERLIGTGDADLRRQYAERFGALAAEQLQIARRSRDPQMFAAIAKRYLHTPAGQDAARALANLFRDTGDTLEAAYWTGRLASATGEEPPAEIVASPTFRVPPSNDWPQPFGGPTQHGRFAEADPVLLERWSQPVAVRPAIAEQVDWLVRDLVDSDRACVPAAMPLAIEGKIITRTLRGLSVLDADTGRLLWESTEGVSVERLLAGEVIPRPGGEPTGQNVRSVPEYRGSNPDGHPLAGLLFRDGVYGLISSDGEQVFVLEDHASLSYRQPGYFWGQRVQDDPFERDWATNRLVSYDLETGSVRWRIGGEQWNEPFDPPLAGTLFLGPPVIEGDELFVIGERGSTMSLFALDRLTGQPIWSHVISYVGAQIEQDLVRRWWPAQPAVGKGVIVCPTTAGWLVAVDRLQRRIRWTYRYIEARQKQVRSNRPRVASSGPLNARWSPSAPVMSHGHVLFTPPELPDPLYGDQPRVICLNLLTGERVWWEEKDTRLYLGGVADGRVLLVGKESVEARELATGKWQWETPLTRPAERGDNGDGSSTRAWLGDPGTPSGRGIIAGDEYLLPVQSGQLLGIDIETGEVRRTLALREVDQPLGNLLIHQGRLLSAGPDSVRCFEERAAIAAELAGDGGDDASAASRLRAAELQVVERRFAAARETLLMLDASQLNAGHSRQFDELLWDTLLQLVRHDLTAADGEFAELSGRADTDERRLTVERLRADRMLARGDRVAAFNVYWEQAQTPRTAMIEEDLSTLRFDRWLAGRLRTLWESATDDERRRFDEQIAAAAEAAADKGDASLNWWAEVLRFHPGGQKIRRTIAEQAIDEQQWALAETTLLQLTEEAQGDELRAWAFERLVRLMVEQERLHDAVAYIERYAEGSPGFDAFLAEIAEQLPEEARIPAPAWSDGSWKLARSPASFNRAMFEPQLAIQPGVPSFEALRLRVEPNLHRLAILKLSGETLWETPLRAQPQSFYNQTTAVGSIGQVLLVVHRGVLHAVSLADRELMWRREFDVQSASAGYVRGPSLVRHQELRTMNSFLWSDGLRQLETPLGMLAVWRPGYVAYFGRHTITLADPLTGRILWSRSGIPPRTMIHGTTDTLYIVPPSSDDPYAVRVLDGSTLDSPRLKSLMTAAVAVNDAGIVQIEERRPFRLFGRSKASIRLRLVDPVDGAEAWNLNFPVETRFAKLDDDEILAVEPKGDVHQVNCRDGRSRSWGTVGEDVMADVQRVYAVSDRNRALIAFNRPPRPGTYSQRYQSTPIHGTLAAFDRSGGLLWKETIEDQSLIVDQLAHLPALIFAAKRNERDGDVTTQQLSIEVRNPETGELLLEDDRYITGGDLREMEVNHAARFIDLKTYSDRLRLSVSGD